MLPSRSDGPLGVYVLEAGACSRAPERAARSLVTSERSGSKTTLFEREPPPPRRDPQRYLAGFCTASVALNPAAAVTFRVGCGASLVSRDAAAETSGARFNVTLDASFHE
jgi:hypothetical protein